MPLCSPHASLHAPALQTLNSISVSRRRSSSTWSWPSAGFWNAFSRTTTIPPECCKLNRDKPQLRLSETVLQQALDFLEQQGSISTYTQRCPSRGRPRRMLHLQPDARREAEQLMEPWHSWLDSHSLVLS